MEHLIVCGLLTLYLSVSSGARVLVLSHMYGSHIMINMAAAQELPKRGHEVYIALGTGMKVPQGTDQYGFKVLQFKHPGRDSPEFNIEEFFMKRITTPEVLDLDSPSRFAFNECELVMGDKDFVDEVRRLNFDLFVIDYFLFSHCLEMLPVSLGIRFVTVSPIIEEHIMRTPSPASFLPVAILPYTGHMTFLQRVKNFLVGALWSFPRLSPIPRLKNTTLLRKYIKDPDIREWSDLARKASMHFITIGPLAEIAAPMMPNTVTIEGISALPARPLDEELEAVVRGAPHGIVLVSFGSGVRHLPTEHLKRFLKAFGQRKETFLWAIQVTGNMARLDVPENVKLRNWLPQNDLLGHRNTRLFITHCGNNGRYEAIYHAVPMLGFPIFGDQPHNAIMIQDKGYGIFLQIHSFTSEMLLEALAKILDSTVYHETVKKASQILKSSPMSPRQKTAYWIEHIIKFGDSHLSSPALTMPHYQFAMWDIFALISSVAFLLFLIVMFILKLLCRLILGRSQKRKID